MRHRHGHPLYCPEPNVDAEENHRKEGVSIGDVGQLIFTGEFDVAFNVHGALNLPPSMRPQKSHPTGRTHIDPGTVYHSSGASYEHSQGTFSAWKMSVKLPLWYLTPLTFINRFKVKCDSSEGAILVLPEGGILFYTKDKNSYKKLAAQYAESWYKHIMAERDAPNGALCLVTGCLKTNKWGIVGNSDGATTAKGGSFGPR